MSARAHIAEVSLIARQSLADVRATASAIREVRVATEVASARSVLLAAGIESSVPSAIEPMPDATSDLFGYVIREAVTNVVRHSEARHCVITVDRPRGDCHRRRPWDAGRRHRRLRASGTAGAAGVRRRYVRHRAGAGRRHADPGQLPGRAGARACGRLGAGGQLVISVLLVDDQALIRQAFAALLELESDLTVVGQAADAAIAVELGGRPPARRGVDGCAAARPTVPARMGCRPPPASWRPIPGPGSSC